jgi:sortilin (neurotensin receptor 3)/type IX secretion system substrate protein
MKKLFLSAISVLLCQSIFAQPWMHSGSAAPQKFSDVVAGYSLQLPKENVDDEIEANGVRKEGTEHLFEKWEWYWRQHLDKDGYVVPPMYTLTAWQKYTETSAKKEAKTTAIPSNWSFQGPHTSGGGYSGIGRINVVAFDPVDSNTFYVGSAAGSTWKTSDGGSIWASCYDFLPAPGVADIKVNPINRNTIYVATGDGDHGDTYSSGVIVSHDGGANWLTTGLLWLPTAYINARTLLINPLDTNSMLLGTDQGIYKTYNAGITWTKYSTSNFKQILYKPTDTSRVYGTIYTDSSCQIVLSTNGGLTFNAVTSFRDAQRINIAVCPASTSLVMALASNNSSGLKGVYSSTDNGASYAPVFVDDTACTEELLGWELGLPTTSCGGQGWYDLCIAIDPANPSAVTIGGINTYYSSDGGLSWQIANQWYGGLSGVATVHADKHCLAYNKVSGALFETCDGGVYKNYGPLTAPWTDLSTGICITEFYRNAVDNGVSFCIGGAQDVGTKMVNAGVATDLTGGDGMQPLINYGDPANIFYCSSQNGNISMTRDGGLSYHNITDTLHSTGGWVTPYIIHPSDTATLLIGYKNVYMSHNNGISWTAISPIFDSNSFINDLVMAPTNPNYIYTVQDNYTIWKSVIHYTTNSGTTWDTLHIPFTNFISDIVIDPKDEKRIWVTVSGYGTDKVYGYDLATNIWTNESGTLPDLPIDCMLIDTVTHTSYIGTDAAVFYKDTTMSDWALFNTHLPTVHVYDLHINYATGDLWAATFGRGMWKTRKAEFPGTLSVAQLTTMSIDVQPNPNHGSFTITTANGELVQGPVTVKLITSDGRIISQSTQTFDSNGSLKINANGITPGFYICEVVNKGVTSHARVVVY